MNSGGEKNWHPQKRNSYKNRFSPPSPHRPLEGDHILTIKSRTFQVMESATASATVSAGLRTKKRRGGTPPRRWGWPLPQKATAPILLKNVKSRLLFLTFEQRFTLLWQGSALPANHRQTACLEVLLPLYH